MIEKTFTTVLPDEPYKTTTKLNKTVTCTFRGPRYYLLRCDAETGQILCVDRGSDDQEELRGLITDNEPHIHFQILDAEVNTWEAAYLTRNYTTGPISNYVETLPTGEKYEYHYDDDTSACNQPFYVNDMKYDKGTNSYVRPRYRVHAVAEDDFWASIDSQKETFAKVVKETDKYSAEKMAAIKAYYDFLSTAKTKYAGVNHWKIPFPQHPPL